MPPRGLAILIGAGPTSGAGIARILASPAHGNFAVALLARNPDNLNTLAKGIRSSTPNPIETFPSDTTPEKLTKAFSDIRSHSSFKNLKLRVAIFHVKHSSRKPFLEETHAEFVDSLNTYVGGAMAFAQEAVKRMFEDNGKTPLAEGGEKKGTLIFTGTLGALRTNTNFAAYGASRAGARSLAQALAKEYSPLGLHVVHTILNGGVKDEDGEAQRTGKTMSAEEVGKAYLWLAEQGPSMWTHELDMRPPQEKF
ncbi:hypothetical protein JMJ35_010052 [Cladonia borealis]|uniref:Oxidoreductase n=1 Tax=Cladonia borealis TaxID=184061 RepID=A0AA39QTB7_9LECA|nr:hypothetical protein JMJ35_010052 [Cladonia borealis]